jgi:DNA-binding MarR family transcriptional regulator
MPLEDADRLPPVAGLLRRPAVFVRHEVMAGLHAAGFDDVLPGHLAVFQHPGPEGQRPGMLAARTEASKQAMNHLLHQLEEGGYLVREQRSGDQRTRVVRLTEQGRRVDAVIRETLVAVDDEWRQALGDEQHSRLARALQQLHVVLEARLPSS